MFSRIERWCVTKVMTLQVFLMTSLLFEKELTRKEKKEARKEFVQMAVKVYYEIKSSKKGYHNV